MMTELEYVREVRAIYASGIGLARVALNRGDPERARKHLDDAVEKAHAVDRDYLISTGADPETVAQFLGERS